MRIQFALLAQRCDILFQNLAGYADDHITRKEWVEGQFDKSRTCACRAPARIVGLDSSLRKKKCSLGMTLSEGPERLGDFKLTRFQRVARMDKNRQESEILKLFSKTKSIVMLQGVACEAHHKHPLSS